MESHSGRSIEVDFFRGIVLIVIVLDHIPGSVLSHFMLHAYALCDSAEVFVFLGGYACAAAYTGLRARRGEQAARVRFLKRCWEIYCAYLLTAVLTLLSGAVLARANLNPAMVSLSGWIPFSSSPLRSAFDIASLRWQPYLSSVLPMYMIFAPCVPLTVQAAQRAPVATLSASVALWAVAGPLAAMLEVYGFGNWAFNPLAWQLMFVLGMLCRVSPVPHSLIASDTGRWITRIALAAVLAFAAVKLLVLTQPLPGHLKQNLSLDRVVNFVAIAWLAGRFVRSGGIARLARRLPAVVTVGRTGLVCFVAGTVVSLVVDTVTPHTPSAFASALAALAGDLTAIAALLTIARGWTDLKMLSRATVNGTP